MRMTHLPNSVKSSAVFLTINPVTQSADEAENRASIREIPCEAIGRERKNVPIAIMPR